MTRFKQYGSDKTGVLATNNDTANGIGTYTYLVDIDAFAGSKSRFKPIGASENGLHEDSERGLVCALCGSDRAVIQAHTEIAGYGADCRNCSKTLWTKE